VDFLELRGAEVARVLLTEDRYAPTVDIAHNVPDIGRRYNNRFCLVIGNEFYSTFQRGLTDETNVEYARSDANLFAQYAQKVFGVPDRNLLIALDATTGQMMGELRKLMLLAKNYGSGAEIIVFYAGHGIPNPTTGESILLPVDVSASQPDAGIPLRTVLDMVAELPISRCTIFLDACFSGLGRNAPLIAERGVRIRPQAVTVLGNTVVFSAATSEQAALPYRQARHGLFTYHLLKTLHEYENVTYGFLAEKIEGEVALNALLIHNRKQNPVTTAAVSVGTTWQGWRVSEAATGATGEAQSQR
jgi:hypothetical protein